MLVILNSKIYRNFYGSGKKNPSVKLDSKHNATKNNLN